MEGSLKNQEFQINCVEKCNFVLFSTQFSLIERSMQEVSDRYLVLLINI